MSDALSASEKVAYMQMGRRARLRDEPARPPTDLTDQQAEWFRDGWRSADRDQKKRRT